MNANRPVRVDGLNSSRLKFFDGGFINEHLKPFGFYKGTLRMMLPEVIAGKSGNEISDLLREECYLDSYFLKRTVNK